MARMEPPTITSTSALEPVAVTLMNGLAGLRLYDPTSVVSLEAPVIVPEVVPAAYSPP